jgi:hypothetical protein
MTTTPGNTKQHRRCYARGMGNCAGKISREHYFSSSLYKLLAGGESLTIEGTHWLKSGSSVELAPSALTAKVLCEHHNSSLSVLDAEALRFFLLLRYETTTEEEHIDGELLERWYLKVLIGQMAATKVGWTPTKAWLDVLFGVRAFPPHAGLLVPVAGAKLRGVYNGADMQLHFSDPMLQVPAGLFLRLGWFGSYLAVDPEIAPGGFTYSFRPREISVSYPGRRKVAIFSWSGIPVVFSGPIPQHPT